MKTNKRFTVFFALILTASATMTKAADSSPTAPATAPALPALGADINKVTVSGISAGAFVAGQLQVAYSSSIHGVGLIAGGPWNCAQAQTPVALTACMSTPSLIDVSLLNDQLKAVALLHAIDPTKNLQQARAYIYNSDQDKLVKPPMLQKNIEFWTHWIPAANTKIEHSIASGHGMPTLTYGVSCDTSASPFLNNCDYDAAGATLKQLYPNQKLQRTTMVPANLVSFSQDEFGADSRLDSSGYAYIPQACRAQGAHCPVHMALHGCGMAQEVIKDTYVVNAGYNEWAEGSELIVIYPQIKSFLLNPQGCFDWFGYTGVNYADKRGPQMQALKAMLDRATSSTRH